MCGHPSDRFKPTKLSAVSLLHPFTSTSARDCLLRGSTRVLRPSSVMLWQSCRLRERSAVSPVSTRRPLSVKRPPSSFNMRRLFRQLCAQESTVNAVYIPDYACAFHSKVDASGRLYTVCPRLVYLPPLQCTGHLWQIHCNQGMQGGAHQRMILPDSVKPRFPDAHICQSQRGKFCQS